MMEKKKRKGSMVDEIDGHRLGENLLPCLKKTGYNKKEKSWFAISW